MKTWFSRAGLGLSILLVGCGGGGDDAASVISASSGKAVDGYIAGADVLCGGTTEKTNNAGEFNFRPACSDVILVRGGINADTKLPFRGLLKAPPGSTFVTPLTSLMVDGGLTTTEIAIAFGLPAGTDVTKIDPIGNLELQKKTLVAQQILQQAADTLSSLTGTSTDSVSEAYVQALYSDVVKAVGSTVKLNAGTPLINAGGTVNVDLVKLIVQQSVVNASTNSNAILAPGQSLGAFSPASVASVTSLAIASQAQAFVDLPSSATPAEVT
jgi:hypothetical protein